MRSTAIDSLFWEVQLRTLSIFLDLVSARWFSEHGHEEVSDVLVSHSACTASVSWEKSEFRLWPTHLPLVVVVGAVFLLAVGTTITLVDPVVVWVVLSFLPAVTVDAAVLKVTPITVGLRLLFSAPEAALLSGRVLVDVWLASEVLPVVCIFTFVALMTLYLVIEGAPDRLEVKHVEVGVLLHAMEQITRELLLTVGEGTHVTEVA